MRFEGYDDADGRPLAMFPSTHTAEQKRAILSDVAECARLAWTFETETEGEDAWRDASAAWMERNAKSNRPGHRTGEKGNEHG